jgi:hypothetical protein
MLPRREVDIKQQSSDLMATIRIGRRFTARRDTSKYGKRHKPGEMNQTESAYAELLQVRKLAGEIVEWWFEGITFKLADDLRYTPDFAVQLADGSMEFIDCKGAGPIDPKSLVKIKAAAEKFFQFQFVIEKKQPKNSGGGWVRTNF